MKQEVKKACLISIGMATAMGFVSSGIFAAFVFGEWIIIATALLVALGGAIAAATVWVMLTWNDEPKSGKHTAIDFKEPMEEQWQR